MLKEYLEKSNFLPNTALQNTILGVQACRFCLHSQKADCPILLSKDTDTPSFEMIFCCKGTLILEHTNQNPSIVQAPKILLLSNQSSIHQIQITQDLEGILVSIHTEQLYQGLQSFYALMGKHDFRTKQAEDYMQMHDGYVMIPQTPWSNAIFSTILHLPESEWEHYCIWKALELLYLLGTHNTSSFHIATNSRLAPAIAAIRTYMQAHLDEKLTIASLSHKFCLSPTTLKVGFRQMYGESVHKCLQRLRIAQAAKLLSTSTMTVLQIAQSVGYDGVSQFNVVFKKTYGLTPTQYRKMSVSVNICHIPQDR